MRAAVVRQYGGPEVVEVAQVPDPTPGTHEVIVRVDAAAVTSADARIRGATFPPGFAPFARAIFGLTRPRRKVLGGSLSGVVSAVGKQVDSVAVGDAVCGTTGMRLGAHAELVAVPAKRLVRIPDGVSSANAAAVIFGGTTALHFLRDKAQLQPGQRVLVNGGSGAVGTSAIQLARHLGAEVTAVTSGANVGLVTKLGAHQTIDYTQTPLRDIASRFDVVLDTVGTIDIELGRRLVTDTGVLLLAVASLGQTVRARGQVKAGSAPERVEDIAHLLDLVARGQLSPVIERTVSLEELREAYRLIDSGRKVGNVLLTPNVR